MIKKIGNGEQIRIWAHRWIPAHFDVRSITPGDGQAVTIVSELLTSPGVQNEELIHEIFFTIDADAILKILINQQFEDSWAWELEKYGNYSIKSAY